MKQVEEFSKILAVWIAIAVLVLLSSCKTHVEYVPVYKSKYITEWAHDTIETKDTFINNVTTIVREVDSLEMARLGIRMDKERKAWLIEKSNYEREVSKLKNVSADTIIKVDSIEVPVPVEKKLTKWQQFKLDAFGILSWVLAIFAIVVVVMFYRNKKC